MNKLAEMSKFVVQEKIRVLLVALLPLPLVVVLAVPLVSETLVVDPKGGGSHTAIQPAMDAAEDGDEVLVRPGEYVISEPIDSNRLHDPDVPDSPAVKNIALRAESGAQQTVIRLAAGLDGPEWASVVIFENGEGAESVLEGFTLTGGMEDGGGVYCQDHSSPTLRDCVITGNLGSGVSCRDSSPLVMDCTITGNLADEGGGVSCRNSSPILTGCTIQGNLAVDEDGGGVYCANSSPTLENCTITGNSADEGGGGIYCAWSSSPRVIGCTISGNSADSGGAVYCMGQSSPIFENCVLAGNLADSGGGVHCVGSASPSLVNCTITMNSAQLGSAVHCLVDSHPRLSNGIVWDNTAGQILIGEESALQVSFSCIEGQEIWPGNGNINENPLFVRDGLFDFERLASVKIGGFEHSLPDFILDPGDYRLQSGSPAIDAGTLLGAPNTDADGNARPCGVGVDLGAYEDGDCPPAPGFSFLRGDCNGDGHVAGEVTDSVFLLNFNFVGGPEPPCLAACEANGDGVVQGEVTDAVYLLIFNFLGGPAPTPPFPHCGFAALATDDVLGCEIPPDTCQ